jgi:DNA-binding transcriptional MocR family regulator
VSPTVALGYRIGWPATSDSAGNLARAKFCTSVACPGLPQRVLARYLEHGGYDRYLRQLRAEIRRDRDRFRAAIAEYFPTGTRVSNPQGGVVLWVQLPEHVDGLALFHHALAKRIGIAPGLIFSAKAGYRNYIRLAMGAGWSPRVQQALQRLGELVARTTRNNAGVTTPVRQGERHD